MKQGSKVTSCETVADVFIATAVVITADVVVTVDVVITAGVTTQLLDS